MKLRRRKTIALKLHAYFGMLLGVPLAVVCFTGALLVFQSELLPVFYPNHYLNQESTNNSLTIDTKTFVMQREQEGEVARIFFPTPSKETYSVMYKGDSVYRFYNGETGVYQDSMTHLRGAFKPLLSLHRNFMIPKYGKGVVGYCTLLFWMVILVSGIKLFVKPKAMRRRQYFRIGRKNTMYNSHRVLGFYLALPLLFLAFSGNYISFPKTYKSIIYSITGNSEEGLNRHSSPKINPSEYNAPISFFTVFTKADSLNKTYFKGKDLNYIMWSSKPTRAVSLGFENWETSFGLPDRGYASVHPFTGDVMNERDNSTMNTNQKITRSLVYFHMGKLNSLFLKWILFFAALGGTWFSISGVLLFIKREGRGRIRNTTSVSIRK